MTSQHKSLIHPTIDFLMIGGLSLIYILFVWVFKIQSQMTRDEFITLFFALSFIFNFPHFAATYLLFYGEQRVYMLSRWGGRLIGVVAPVLLFLFILISYAITSWRDIAYVVSLMFVLVGWHYTKQVFGCMVVTANRHGYTFNKTQHFFIKLSLLTLWLSTMTLGSGGIPVLNFHTLTYPFYFLPEKLKVIEYGVIVIATSIFILATVLRYKKQKEYFPWMSIVPFIAIHFWFLPILNHEIIFLAIPLFHSLQYLLFVGAYKKNQFSPAKRFIFPPGAVKFFILSFFFGAFFMDIIPRALDLTFSFSKSNITIFLVMFTVFINIHHYLMDFLLWRRDVPGLSKYLFVTGQES